MPRARGNGLRSVRGAGITWEALYQVILAWCTGPGDGTATVTSQVFAPIQPKCSFVAGSIQRTRNKGPGRGGGASSRVAF